MQESNEADDAMEFGGSMRAGHFTAQLFVKLVVTRTKLVLRTSLHTFQIDRENLRGLGDTAIFGIFKRGIRFHHCQPNLAQPVVFYPSMDREAFRQKLRELGWE